MNNYELILTSYPESEDFVVEIWFQNNLISILKENNETEFFYDKVGSSFFEKDEFNSIMIAAKEKLNL
ncbi:MAG: hypothetical protein FWH17_09250 [Oscillospiraceae bacterium]|nr:hypothetical protein [Oscillospiraceae bacterium]